MQQARGAAACDMRRVSAACQSAALCVGGRGARTRGSSSPQRARPGCARHGPRPSTRAATRQHCTARSLSTPAAPPARQSMERHGTTHRLGWTVRSAQRLASVLALRERKGRGEPVQRMRTATKRSLGQRRTFGVWCVLPARSTASSEGNHSPVERRNKDGLSSLPLQVAVCPRFRIQMLFGAGQARPPLGAAEGRKERPKPYRGAPLRGP
jgi:hypothetical protein